MSRPPVAVIVLAKSPVAGRVKTRCTPPCSPQQAADLALAALLDTLHAVRSSSADRCVVALDGAVADWLPTGFDVVGQVGGPLGCRIDAALAAVGGAALLIGMDTPQVSVGLIDSTLTLLRASASDCVLGPSTDGGFWGIGVAHGVDPHGLCSPVAMSRDTTGADQLARLIGLGLTCSILAPLTDVDDFPTALDVAALVPGSGFAAVVSSIQDSILRTRAGAA